MTDALNSNDETTKSEDESESRREIKSSDENCLEGGASCCNGVTNCKNEITVNVNENKNENVNKNENNISAKTFSNTMSSETADRINQLNSDSISSKSPDVKTPVVSNKMKKIPLFCKIRICEDGGDTFEATKTFCEGEELGLWIPYDLFSFFITLILKFECNVLPEQNKVSTFRWEKLK